jgi:hypothetical protein
MKVGSDSSVVARRFKMSLKDNLDALDCRKRFKRSVEIFGREILGVDSAETKLECKFLHS